MAWKLRLTQLSSMTFLLVIFLVNRVNGVGVECKKGQIKDLDGKCVKKILFVKPERKSCPTPSVVNGEFVLTGDRFVEYNCKSDLDYVMAPQVEFAICQILGTWSKPVPSCLLPGCHTPPAPNGGVVAMEFSDTVARFSCMEGFLLEGEGVLGCEDGSNWNSSAPTCKKCSAPPAPDGGEVFLENHGARARFSCQEGFSMVGGAVMDCVDGTNWSSQVPKCEKIVSVATAIPVAVGVTASQADYQSFNRVLFIAVAAAYLYK